MGRLVPQLPRVWPMGAQRRYCRQVLVACLNSFERWGGNRCELTNMEPRSDPLQMAPVWARTSGVLLLLVATWLLTIFYE